MTENSKKLLHALGAPAHKIRRYTLTRVPACSTPSGIGHLSPEQLGTMIQLMTDFENQYEIYHVITSQESCYKIVNFLLCPLDSEGYNIVQSYAEKGCALAFCLNTTFPPFSAMDFIEVQYKPSTESFIRTF